MALLDSTTSADIERLQTAVRSDRENASREVEARLAQPDLLPAHRQELLFLRATVCLETAQLAGALETGRAVAATAEANGELKLLARVHNLLGLTHWRLGDLPQALEMFSAARHQAIRVAAADIELQATGNMCLIHAAQKHWDEAARGFREVLNTAELSGNTRLIAITSNNLSCILWERDGATTEALALAQRALELKLPGQDWVSIAQTANNIVGLHCDLKNYPAAEEALAAAALWVKRANAAPCNFYYALNRAQLKVALDNPSRDDDDGFAAFAEAVTIAHEANLLEDEARAHEHTAKARASHAQPAEAYAHLLRCMELREKYLTEQTAQRIEKLRQAYEIDRLEREHRAERARREALESLNAQLARTGRERDSLLRLIGHDLRTHIGGMIGLGDLIGLSLPEGDENRRNAEDLVALGESTLALLQEILEHGSALDGAFAGRDEVDLIATLHEIKRRLEPHFAAKQQPFTLEAPTVAVTVRTNRSGLSRIVENLLTNAAKFSPPGAATTLRLQATGDQWRIAVIDRGQGIPAHETARLFQTDQRLSVRPTAGEKTTGLGLLLAQDIALMIGVTLAHEPTPGGGATFHVSFPPRHAPAATPGPSGAAAATAPAAPVSQ